MVPRTAGTASVRRLVMGTNLASGTAGAQAGTSAASHAGPVPRLEPPHLDGPGPAPHEPTSLPSDAWVSGDRSHCPCFRMEETRQYSVNAANPPRSLNSCSNRGSLPTIPLEPIWKIPADETSNVTAGRHEGTGLFLGPKICTPTSAAAHRGGRARRGVWCRQPQARRPPPETEFRTEQD